MLRLKSSPFSSGGAITAVAQHLYLRLFVLFQAAIKSGLSLLLAGSGTGKSESVSQNSNRTHSSNLPFIACAASEDLWRVGELYPVH